MALKMWFSYVRSLILAVHDGECAAISDLEFLFVPMPKEWQEWINTLYMCVQDYGITWKAVLSLPKISWDYM
jgi:hypothetical protein